MSSIPASPSVRHKLIDGTEIEVRVLRPEDEPLIVALHAGHSDNTIRMRFFGMVRRLSHESLIRLCHLDYDREMALAAVVRGADGQPHFIGVSRYYLERDTGEAEFAVVVTDAWQGKGVGVYLMNRLIDAAKNHGVKRLAGLVLRENSTMLELVKGLGFNIESTDDPAVLSAVLTL